MSPTADPLAELRKKLASNPASAVAPKPVVPPKAAAVPAVTFYREGPASAAAPAGVPAAAPSITSENVFQRLRYFENLVQHLFAYQKTLIAQVQRTGTAPATMPHYPPLKSPAGDFDPNTQ